MSTTGRPDGNAPAASDLAASLGDADFVRFVAAADGDAVAATALLADALDSRGTPYQATVATLGDGDRATDADVTVAVGRPAAAADLTVGIEEPASRLAFETASELSAPDPVLALAGTVAAGAVPQGTVLEAAEAAGVERRPGLALPTEDPVDGLAHSTLVAGPFSGDVESAGALLADVDQPSGGDEETRRRVASLVALAVASDEEGTERGADAVERILRPYVGGPVETVGGYADVLDAVARERPGLALALALGGVEAETAVQTWREHGRRAHTALSEAKTGRYDGLFVARCEAAAPVGTVARLARDFRSPEPVALVVADGEAAVAGAGDADVGEATRTAAQAVGGESTGTRSWGRARFAAEETEFVVAFREAL